MRTPRRRILVIQWARLGDLFHSRPLCEEVKRRDSRCSITLSCDSQYAGIAGIFPEIDAVLPVNIRQIVAQARSDAMLAYLLDEILALTGQSGSYDTVYNLTNAQAAMDFARMAAKLENRGYGAADSTLPEYDNGTTANKKLHISEQWARFAVSEYELSYPISLAPKGLPERERRMAIICDAGAAGRTLSSETIQCLMEVTEQSGFQYVMLGTILSRSQPVQTSSPFDLRGKTTLDQLHTILRSCSHAVGPDTGALHFAAALGCSTYGLYLDGADPDTTGQLSADAKNTNAELQDKTFLAALETRIYEWLNKRTSYIHSASRRVAARKSVCPLSVIITEHKQVHYTEHLLESMRSCQLPNNSEIIVVSSGMDDADERIALDRSGVRAYVSQESLSFSAACNTGARLAKGDWLLFLNDDCELSPTSFDTLWSEKSVDSIVSPRLRYWDGCVQSAGVAVEDGVVNDIEDTQPRPLADDIDAVSAAAMLMSRAAFLDLGGFDETFLNGYEDVDLCLRAKRNGVQTKVADCDVLHYRGSSPERYDQDDRNQQLFKQRWDQHTPQRKVLRNTGSRQSARLVVISDESVESAGMWLRWKSPLTRLGLSYGRDFACIDTSQITALELDGVIANAEAVVVFRSVSNKAHRDILQSWHEQRGGILIYDCDDVLLNRFPAHSIRAKHRVAFELNVRSLVECADLITCPNETVALQFENTKSSPKLLPTAPLLEHFNGKARTSSDGAFRIGYAGSSTHSIDLAIAIPALERLLNEEENVWFYWWGVHPGKLAYHPRVRCGGRWINDYTMHLKRIRSVPIDLWIAPMNDTMHNKARSPIKAFEYIGMESLSLYSDVLPFRRAVGTRAPDLLIENSINTWYDALADVSSGCTHRLMNQVKCARDHLFELSQDLCAYESMLDLVKDDAAALSHCYLGVE